MGLSFSAVYIKSSRVRSSTNLLLIGLSGTILMYCKDLLVNKYVIYYLYPKKIVFVSSLNKNVYCREVKNKYVFFQKK